VINKSSQLVSEKTMKRMERSGGDERSKFRTNSGSPFGRCLALDFFMVTKNQGCLWWTDVSFEDILQIHDKMEPVESIPGERRQRQPEEQDGHGSGLSTNEKGPASFDAKPS